MKYLLIGIGTGLAAGFAFAPASGKTTRKFVGCKVADAKDFVEDCADQVGHMMHMVKRQNKRLRNACSALVA